MTDRADEVVLESHAGRVEVTLRPFSFSVRRVRSGRSLGQTAARLADGGRIAWRDSRWELPAGREIQVFERSLA